MIGTKYVLSGPPLDVDSRPHFMHLSFPRGISLSVGGCLHLGHALLLSSETPSPQLLQMNKGACQVLQKRHSFS